MKCQTGRLGGRAVRCSNLFKVVKERGGKDGLLTFFPPTSIFSTDTGTALFEQKSHGTILLILLKENVFFNAHFYHKCTFFLSILFFYIVYKYFSLKIYVV